jgi:hypothetical protein
MLKAANWLWLLGCNRWARHLGIGAQPPPKKFVLAGGTASLFITDTFSLIADNLGIAG